MHLLARIHTPLRWFTAATFVLVGVLHFTHADTFVRMMPPYLPWHLELVWLSGVFEILGGVGLLVPFSRRFATFGLLALLVAVFPANVHMAMNEVYLDGLPQSPVALWLRLPYQLVIALQVWFVGLWQPPTSGEG
ncbi:MAG: DoxX family membrane protein [Deltaproteobacteria bacterium]|nr:MAG: DoxX family membrane protein [Deltaproteobacteria bacterium]